MENQFGRTSTMQTFGSNDLSAESLDDSVLDSVGRRFGQQRSVDRQMGLNESDEITFKKRRLDIESQQSPPLETDCNGSNHLLIDPLTPPTLPQNFIDFNQSEEEEHLMTSSPQLDQWLNTFGRWPHAQRIVALGSLVNTPNICDIREIRYLLSIIEPQLQRDFIRLLPKELALYVLSFLGPKELLRASQTCQYWHILCEDNLLWREKCREEGLLDDQETLADIFERRINRNNRKRLVTRMEEDEEEEDVESIITTPETTSTPTIASYPLSAFIHSKYKQAYLKQHEIEFNWRYGRFPNEPPSDALKCPKRKPNERTMKEILHLKGHDDCVITCLQFNPHSNLIVSGSDDNTLKVWSSSNGRCLRTLQGHSGGVWCSQLSPDNIVISGSTDRSLKVWNALNGECMHTLTGHTSTVRCMALNGRTVVSGSRDATLRVWDIYTGECNNVLIGHVAAVRCVQFNGETVVSGAYDYLVKVWDVATETCLYTLEGHTNRVYSLQFDGENIISGSLDTYIKVWSASTGLLKHNLIGHQSLTSGMQLKGHILVSGNADSTVKVWDINTGECLQTLAGPSKHQSAVTCLQFNSSFVITSSDDGTVKLWDLKTGEFIRNLVSLPSGGSGGVVWRIRASNTKLVCAVGSRNGTEDTAIKILNMDPEDDEGGEEIDEEADLMNSLTLLTSRRPVPLLIK